MKVCVIGGGPAGLMSAIMTAKNGNDVTLLEKNEKVGKKLYITGKGRCNLTNNIDVQVFLNNIVNNSKFMISSLNQFSPQNVMQFFDEHGVKLKTERGNRVFPNSDKASDITKCLINVCEEYKVKICCNEKVLEIKEQNGRVNKVITNLRSIMSDIVVVATGGLSYSATGSTGDGYNFAKKLGHTIVAPRASLVGLNIKNTFCKELQGLALKNVNVSILRGEKLLCSEFGEMLFTHFGVSGPTILSLSSRINREDLKNLKLIIDLKPALTLDTLDVRILRDFNECMNKQFKNSLDNLMPKSLIPIIIKLSNINEDKPINKITAEERKKLGYILKNLELSIASLRDIDEGIVTSGGVSVKEINPKTMESKIIKGLYFCGEVIDVDAVTGGFNIQLALSTGFAVGNNL